MLPLSERPQEAQHSLVAIAAMRRKPLLANMSLTLRHSELLGFLRDEVWSDVLLEFFEKACSVNWIANTWGYCKHTLWSNAKASQKSEGTRHNFDSLMDMLFYSNSPECRFRVFKEVQSRHKAKQRLRDKMVKQLRSLLTPKDNNPLRAIRSCAAQDHLRKHLRCSDVMYSLPMDSGCQVFHGLDDVLANPLQQRRIASTGPSQPNDDFSLEADVASLPARCTPRTKHTFFKLVSAQPSAGRHMRSGAATSGRLRCGDIAITLHQMTCLQIGVTEDNNDMVHVSVSPKAHLAKFAVRLHVTGHLDSRVIGRCFERHAPCQVMMGYAVCHAMLCHAVPCRGCHRPVGHISIWAVSCWVVTRCQQDGCMAWCSSGSCPSSSMHSQRSFECTTWLPNCHFNWQVCPMWGLHQKH